MSSVERDLLRIDAPGADVRILSNLHQVTGHGPGWAERSDLLFVGGFRHPPNVDAVLWFVREVFPLIRAKHAEINLHCIGADVPAEIRVLGSRPGVEIHGHVPDLQPWMDRCRVSVAPLRYGAGVKGKINQAMAHGLPVVATSPAVEGMHLRDGVDVLVADSAEAFAQAVLRLNGDAALWEQIATHALQNVTEHFSLDAARQTVRELFLA